MSGCSSSPRNALFWPGPWFDFSCSIWIGSLIIDAPKFASASLYTQYEIPASTPGSFSDHIEEDRGRLDPLPLSIYHARGITSKRVCQALSALLDVGKFALTEKIFQFQNTIAYRFTARLTILFWYRLDFL